MVDAWTQCSLDTAIVQPIQWPIEELVVLEEASGGCSCLGAQLPCERAASGF